jgi:hypothetical protein
MDLSDSVILYCLFPFYLALSPQKNIEQFRRVMHPSTSIGSELSTYQRVKDITRYYTNGFHLTMSYYVILSLYLLGFVGFCWFCELTYAVKSTKARCNGL